MVAKKNGKLIDVNPQFLRFEVTMTGANTYTEKQVNTPVLQMMSNEKALVMEILKVIVHFRGHLIVNAQYAEMEMHLADRSLNDICYWNESPCVAHAQNSISSTDTAATDATLATANPPQPQIIDLTDGNGNGYLYGKNAIFVAADTLNYPAGVQVTGAILYRLKEVSASELLGIINS